MINGEYVGPMTAIQMMSYNVNQNTPVSLDGVEWKPLYTFPELMQLITQKSTQDSNRILCGVLALLIGGLGIHYFVIGKAMAGILTIILSIVTCGIWGLVMFIQGIMMLVMSDAEFNQKYVQSQSSFPLF